MMLEFSNYNEQKYVTVKGLRIPHYYAKKEIEGDGKRLLIESVKVNGVKKPIVINTYPGREGIIIDGAEIYKISLGLGIEELPCYCLDVPQEKEKELHYLFSTNVREYSIDEIINQLSQEYLDLFADMRIPKELHNDIFEVADEELKIDEVLDLQRIKSFPLRFQEKYGDYPKKLQGITGAKSQNEAIVKLIIDVVEGRISL